MVVLEPIGRTMETGHCYVCHGTKLITDSHSCELICANCGLVISDRAQDYEGTENVSNSRYNMALYTTMRDITRDANGHILDIITRSKMNRLKRLDTSTKNGSNLKDVFDNLDNLKHVLSLSDTVVEKTAYIYRKVRHRSLIRGRSRFSMLGACLYLACRELQTGRTMKDIIQVTNLKKKDLSRDYRLLLFELDLKSPVIDPVKCVAKIANITCVSERSKREAIDVMNNIIRLGMATGKHPMGLAASLVYLSCNKTGESRTQAQIAEAAGITQMTLRNRIKDIKGISHIDS
ncbi:MAG TPA: transcription initiation factor IIB [Candidatus Bathyarchaeia archaeon]|nr:transcription initiation factor IIB [Candidatus Bathyarchaeia archaeon]